MWSLSISLYLTNQARHIKLISIHTDSLPTIQSGNCLKITSENTGCPSFVASLSFSATEGYLYRWGLCQYELNCAFLALFAKAINERQLTISSLPDTHSSFLAQWHICYWSFSSWKFQKHVRALASWLGIISMRKRAFKKISTRHESHLDTFQHCTCHADDVDH